MPVSIHPVETEADKRAFYKFAFRVYKDDPAWAPRFGAYVYWRYRECRLKL